MAISYEDWKTQYEWMSTDQQAKYANMVKWNATAEEYANRYIQENRMQEHSDRKQLNLTLMLTKLLRLLPQGKLLL